MSDAIFLLVFCTMVPTSVYLLVKHRRSNLVFWGAITLLFAGLSGLQVAFEHYAIPFFRQHGMSMFWLEKFIWVSDKLNSTIHSVPYWSILLFFLHYAGFSNKYFNTILPIPVWISIWNKKIGLVLTVNYPFILAWGIPYAICSYLLLFYVLIKEKQRAQIPRHLATAAIFLAPETALILYQSDGWILNFQSNLLIAVSFLLLFSISLVIVLYLQNAFLNVNRKTVIGKIHVGTKMMQHAIKNAAGKIKLNALNIRQSLNRQNYDDASRQLDYLLATNEHLIGMMDKLSYMTRNKIMLSLVPHDLLTVAKEVTAPLSSHTEIVFLLPSSPVSVPIDKALVVECLTNIIDNALEAMDDAGTIEIGLQRKKSRLALSIADSGKGMNPEQLAMIAEPFYSTKAKSGRNFGLGMYYVKKVMDAHNGKLYVASQIGKGTCVTLEFPIHPTSASGA
ncbi:sensor histidine kinase [Paenibacillus cymbidii]|uniref:sensor histidine kinase n=1 Tax=Paenibacillus cymbidii TaxID=1639034 RepID=UPI001080B825|nr:HAMP domain-containing sensor histidine kinase [Paenibacillus cymbidii]